MHIYIYIYFFTGAINNQHINRFKFEIDVASADKFYAAASQDFYLHPYILYFPFRLNNNQGKIGKHEFHDIQAEGSTFRSEHHKYV